MPKAYRFPDWDSLYENNKSREIETLSYFMQSNKLVGEGLGFLRQQADWLELYGTLGFLKILASQSRKKFRGWLVKKDSPLDAGRISALTGIPVAKVQRALDFFSSAPMDWLELTDMTPAVKRQGSGTTGAVTGGVDVVPDLCPPAAKLSSGLRTDKGLTEEEERERDNGSAIGKREQDSTAQLRQFAAIGARIEELQRIPEEDRSEEQEEELKKMRVRRKKIQKKQAANDFTPITPEGEK